MLDVWTIFCVVKSKNYMFIFSYKTDNEIEEGMSKASHKVTNQIYFKCNKLCDIKW